jgi:hypothetical protein
MFVVNPASYDATFSGSCAFAVVEVYDIVPSARQVRQLFNSHIHLNRVTSAMTECERVTLRKSERLIEHFASIALFSNVFGGRHGSPFDLCTIV